MKSETLNSGRKRTLTVDLWIEDGNAMAEFLEGETGERLSVVVPYSPDEHPEFNEQVGNELYSWLCMLADEADEHRTVQDLNENELAELKSAYFDQLRNTDDAEAFRWPEEIPDDVIMEHYDGICFVKEDFFCNCSEDFEGCGAAYSGI